jgi:hypothetical protein
MQFSVRDNLVAHWLNAINRKTLARGHISEILTGLDRTFVKLKTFDVDASVYLPNWNYFTTSFGSSTFIRKNPSSIR